ncbi:histone-lysine N-methyltransferase ASHR3-like [Typha angustifolia]|uniref:histone-lysine N-methyltransferase ASHR3-like n=1 Tax=Typha angustifolia TaxID=59011 RepID=UPI003C2E76D5
MSSPWNDRLRSSLSASTTTSSAPKRRRRRNKKEAEGPSLADHVKVWVEKKVASGDPEKECSLPFLTNDPKITCIFHIQEGFHRLPLPYIEEDFQIDSILNDVRENQTEPTPYVPIRRNVYLIKKIRDSVDAGVGCDCSTKSMCKGNCECRSLSVCCSKTCRCLDRCTNKAFRKEKKIEVVKTENCGWGAVASEALEKGDFVIEYIGEVIDDATCTQRLQDMKHRGDQNIYMCKLYKDFIIDSTYKGNASRFFNHGCNPNCKLEKWRVNGETRLGIFASRSIEVGEPLTYDYRLLLFGPMIKCYCGAPNCRGYIGAKKKAAQLASFKIYRRKASSKAFKIYQRKASSKAMPSSNK